MKKKKKLLIASDSFLPRWDGVARFLSEIIPKLKEKYEVTALVPQFKGRNVSYKGIKIVRIPTYNFQVGDFAPPKIDSKKIKKIVSDADIVWTQTIGPIGALSIYHAKKMNKKLVAFIHSVEWELVSNSITRNNLLKKTSYLLTKTVARSLYNKCNLLIVPSKEIEEKLVKNKIKTKKKIIHLGVDIAKFLPSINKSRSKKKVGISPRVKVIGFCGRIAREKDLPTLHKSFLTISKNNTGLRLLIVGTGREKEQKKVEGKNIKITGSVDNVIPYLQAMDIYVLPSLTETSSLSTMEAMSCGLPVVCTKVGHINYYIKNGKNGFLFNKGKDKELSKKLELLLNNEELRNKLGNEARNTIVSNYRWDHSVTEILKILESLHD